MGFIASILAVWAIATHFGQPIAWGIGALLVADSLFTNALKQEVKSAGGIPEAPSFTFWCVLVVQVLMVATSVVALAS